MGNYARSSVVMSALWMIGVSLILFFLPAINGVIGGGVGGYKAGSVGRACAAAILPAVLVGLALWLIFALFDEPIIGFIGGIAIGIWALASSIGVLIGAVIGGAMAPDDMRL